MQLGGGVEAQEQPREEVAAVVVVVGEGCLVLAVVFVLTCST